MDPQHQHPDDERLAAFAAGDGDGEVSLAAHVDTCDRCATLAADLTALRASLAALPDLAPSRPLRFLPPVEREPAAAAGFPTLVRRLFAPAMAAGAALVLMGSVGMAASGAPMAGSGRTGDGGDTVANYGAEDAGDAAGAAPSAAGEGAQFDASSERAAASDGAPEQGEVAAAESTDDQGARAELLGEGSPVTPWLAITIAGALVLVATLVLRWTVVPRAPDPPAYPGA